MAGNVPNTSSLADIYPSDALPFQQKRWTDLLSAFKRTYGRSADYVSRSPGRVNIIGEHIDYSLYDVVPMAVEHDVLLAVALSPANGHPHVRLANLDGAKFPAREFDITDDGDLHIDATVHEWTNYFRAGMHGAVQLLKKEGHRGVGHVSMDVLATGTVPSGGGMSSSAAFVCASALAVVKASGRNTVDKKALVETAVVSERSVGVNSGGMDQSASVFAEQGSALHVSFLPQLSARAISFPETHTPLTFVVAQSLVAADKHVTAPVCYNLRVVECTLAALVLAKITQTALPSQPDSSPLGVSLRTFADAFFAGRKDSEASSHEQKLDTLIQLVTDYLPQEEGYTRQQMSELLGTPIAELEKQYMTKFPVRAEHFKLRQRALHVFTEARRVHDFLALLESSSSTTSTSSPNDTNKSPQPKSASDSNALLSSLGALLNDTQDSCRDLYECSCPELDELCALARSAGAYGSRLTGAGWGGCSVHLVPQDKVGAVRKAWVDKFYRKRFPDITEEKLNEAVVVSKPGAGSRLFLVEGRERVE